MLPSGTVKIIKDDLMCIKEIRQYRKHYKFKKGVKVMLKRGKRSVVRGNAKNPNDHPNGGRTKAKLVYRTP